MSPFLHKTLSFTTGAVLAYGTYIYMSDHIKMNVLCIGKIIIPVVQPLIQSDHSGQ